jgi:molybdopterin-guanine dinucleotide biosynthesis protein A
MATGTGEQRASAYPRDQITGVVLAGGRARRMGGTDKGLVELDGKPMVLHVVESLRPQVGTLLINANRNLEDYERVTGCPVAPDMLGDYSGPLAGMASAMERADTRFILTVPCDSPLLVTDLGERLFRALVMEDAEVSVAHDGERMQPVFALLATALKDSVVEYLRSGERKIDTWYARHRLALADLSDHRETFLNINTPEDRQVLESRLMEAC